MFWADKIAEQIIDSGKYKPYWVDDMKTPSGRIHVGSLRGVVIHDLLYKAILKQGEKAIYTYCINDMDPMDGFPVYLNREKFYKYMGWPLYKIPSPQEGFTSFSQYYAQEFIEVFNGIGCSPQIIWTSDLYAEGRFDELIRIYLDNTDKIRKLFKDQYKNFNGEGYFPYQPICPTCGKIATTKISKWDGEYVYFECKEDTVEYTNGCGFSGKVRPEGQNGKLPWKIEWSAHWKTLGVTIEWSGKDHMTAGGSHEIASKISEIILKYNTPQAQSYEHLLIGGKKMSSSKGLGSSAKEISELLPPYLLRFLFVRTDYRQTIAFDPVGTMAIPDLVDEYDRCWQAYNTDSDEDLSRVFEFAQTDGIFPRNPKLFLPRFRDIANYIQHPTFTIKDKFAEIKGKQLTSEELNILSEREKYAQIWIQKYAPDEYRFQMTIEVPLSVGNLVENQRQFLTASAVLLDRSVNAEQLQIDLYNKAKELNIDTKKAFSAIYTAVLGKTSGPKAAWLIKNYPPKVIKRRFEIAAKGNIKVAETVNTQKSIDKPEYFVIDSAVKKAYPSISIGVALIKNVKIGKTDSDLEKEKQEFLESLEGLTTEQLGKYSEIISYRRLYKEMGIDWHSRRPSPEALLRRVALNKGLYMINTCVDAYNLVVMKNRVSVGAFDLDKFQFPTVLRFPKSGEEILLLGDEKPTKYTEKELAYFDKNGGYNIDFNYRDAQRTAVTENTENLFINVDGVYDITPEMVEKSLKESVAMIVKYCGGEVEFEGVVI